MRSKRTAARSVNFTDSGSARATVRGGASIASRSFRWIALALVVAAATLTPGTDRPRTAEVDAKPHASSSVTVLPGRSTARADVRVGAVPVTPAPRRGAHAIRLEEPRTYALGWYDTLTDERALPGIADEGMNAALPYDSSTADPGAYLHEAQTSGVQVMLEVPRDLVRRGDVSGVEALVSAYAHEPALLGWYLADEPSINPELGPLSPSRATALYRAIKSRDTAHPVAMAFASREDPSAYRAATDIVMWDEYPCAAGSDGSDGLAEWTRHLDHVGSAARGSSGFFPVLQAFGGGRSLLALSKGYRLPTAAEERYMAFASVTSGATGLFFWTRYRTDPAWVGDVLVPVVSELRQMEHAMASGARAGIVTTKRTDVRAAAFIDPMTHVLYIILAHTRPGDVRLSVAIGAPGIQATPLGEPSRAVRVTNGTFPVSLGSFGAVAYRIS